MIVVISKNKDDLYQCMCSIIIPRHSCIILFDCPGTWRFLE